MLIVAMNNISNNPARLQGSCIILKQSDTRVKSELLNTDQRVNETQNRDTDFYSFDLARVLFSRGLYYHYYIDVK